MLFFFREYKTENKLYKQSFHKNFAFQFIVFEKHVISQVDNGLYSVAAEFCVTNTIYVSIFIPKTQTNKLPNLKTTVSCRIPVRLSFLLTNIPSEFASYILRNVCFQ